MGGKDEDALAPRFAKVGTTEVLSIRNPAYPPSLRSVRYSVSC